MQRYPARSSRGVIILSFDARRNRDHNSSVRRFLLALLFGLTAWAALARIVPHAADASTVVTAGVCAETEAGVPEDTGDTDSRWVAAHRAVVSVTESRWKSSGVHATFAQSPSANVPLAIYRVPRGDRVAGTRQPHLLHAPLLI